MGKHINKPPKKPDDGKTGYRKPPKAHQWPKGKSGNPKGRPPGSNGVKTDLKKVLGEVSTVEVGGEWVTGTTQFLMLHAMGKRAKLSDVKAFAALIPLIIQAFGFEDRDVDQNRLSPGDEAILNRLLGRRGNDAAGPKRKPRRRRKPDPAGKANTASPPRTRRSGSKGGDGA